MNNDFIIEVPQNMEDQSYIDFILEDYPITDAEETVLTTRRSIEQIIQQGDGILAHPGVFIYDHILIEFINSFPFFVFCFFKNTIIN